MSGKDLKPVEFVNTELPDILELRNVSLSYDREKVPDEKKKWIIQDLEFLIENIPDRGQFAVIMGPSGCGKSTILRFLAGLQHPTKGEVLIHGKPITDHERISMVFQKYTCLEWYTVLKNVMLPLIMRGVHKKEAEEKAKEMIVKVGLEQQMYKYASSRELSGGQLQRVAIARSLVSNPLMVLMDEPFGALDSYTRLKIQAMLIEMWQEFRSTVVFVTHSVSEAVFLGDDILIMSSNPGRLVERIHIDLPYPRSIETRRMKRFFELESRVENVIQDVGDICAKPACA
jgi:NitT/TauT family transport system ATP-binding protein